MLSHNVLLYIFTVFCALNQAQTVAIAREVINVHNKLFGPKLTWMLLACQCYYRPNWVQILLVSTPDAEFNKTLSLYLIALA